MRVKHFPHQRSGAFTTKKVDLVFHLRYTKAAGSPGGSSRHLAQHVPGLLQTGGKKVMKKIVLSLAAVAAIGVAGCTPKAETANNSADVNATAENASVDVNASVNEAATGNAVTAVQNAGTATGNAVDTGTNA